MPAIWTSVLAHRASDWSKLQPSRRLPQLSGVNSTTLLAPVRASLHGAGEGVATLAVIDGNGAEVDFTEVAVRKAARLGLTNVLGDAVGPTLDGATERWTVNAGQPVSLQARMIVDRSAELIGRIGYTVTLPAGSRLLDTELSGSDRAQGYLYVQPPAGTYPFSFELAVDPTIKVEAVLTAQ